MIGNLLLCDYDEGFDVMNCPNCGTPLDSPESPCPHCQAVNNHTQVLTPEERENFNGITIESDSNRARNSFDDETYESSDPRLRVRYINLNRMGLLGPLLGILIFAVILIFALPLALLVAFLFLLKLLFNQLRG